MIEVRYERGVYLPRQDLWLDPRDAKQFAFVSHAHSDHIAPHEEIIVSERTARLMQSRLPGSRTEHILPFGEKRMVHGVDLMLLPAGHIFGSAQCFLFAGNETLLYTGDFKLRPGKSAELAEWRKAETLIMETTFGLPRYRFPPTEQVINQIIAFCQETIDDSGVPVLLGYSLGKAQEILCSLDGAGLTPMLHGFAASFARDLRERSIEAWALSEENQMEFTLAQLPAGPSVGTSGSERCTGGACPGASEFLAFANVGEAIAATPANRE
jgi:DNA ligase-1